MCFCYCDTACSLAGKMLGLWGSFWSRNALVQGWQAGTKEKGLVGNSKKWANIERAFLKSGEDYDFRSREEGITYTLILSKFLHQVSPHPLKLLGLLYYLLFCFLMCHIHGLPIKRCNPCKIKGFQGLYYIFFIL